jgi:tripartite-type tricarboxylate transporter receptor subunit TctC
MKRRELTLLGASTLLSAFSGSALAQAKFPERPITLVVPSAPGGTTDFSARLVLEPLTAALGQPIVVDNKAGGSGNIGNLAVARAKADGHTLLVAYSGYQVGNPHLFKKAGWDPLKDFEAVAMLTRAPQIVVVRSSLGFKTMQELIAYAKANPGKLNYASSGIGSIQHIAGEMLKQQTSTFMTHIPYRGAGPAVQDLLAGNVDLFITTPASVVGHVKSGRLTGLAVTSNTRLSSLPEVLTVAEAKLPDFKLDSWFALYAPAGTPADVVQTINQAVSKILQQADIKKKAEDAGTVTEVMTPAQLSAYTKKELDFWGQVIKKSNITMD